MANISIPRSLSVILLCLVQFKSATQQVSSLVYVNDNNWKQTLEGEWMIAFFAPWCPACRLLNPIWEDFATKCVGHGIKVGQVDITKTRGLSSRLLVTDLPIIYHVRDGTFRQYKGSRSKDLFFAFVKEKKWEAVKPVPGWQAPSSILMELISQLYRCTMTIQETMRVMSEKQGIPRWVSFGIFGLATIIFGLILGLTCCRLIFICFPSRKKYYDQPTKEIYEASSKVDVSGESQQDDGESQQEDDESCVLTDNDVDNDDK